jgi:hypothetical protein
MREDPDTAHQAAVFIAHPSSLLDRPRSPDGVAADVQIFVASYPQERPDDDNRLHRVRNVLKALRLHSHENEPFEFSAFGCVLILGSRDEYHSG